MSLKICLWTGNIIDDDVLLDKIVIDDTLL